MRSYAIDTLIEAEAEVNDAWRRFCRAAQDNDLRRCAAAEAEWRAACHDFDRALYIARAQHRRPAA